MKRPVTNADLIAAGVSEERIISAWLKAKVMLETARRKRTCRICGEAISKGEECVSSEDDGLVSLYTAFWSLRVYAHKKCYEELTLPKGLPERSHYRRKRYCPRCDAWFDIYNGDNDDAWPRKLENYTRCPHCGGPLRLKPRRLATAPRVAVNLGDIKLVPVEEGQLTLDDFSRSSLIIVRRGDGKIELYKAE